ncbi:MAG TPA: polyphenol oxidase family protein, partial [Bacteroidota bacterium]|nr:polyphenol oxidase family protein [Bacteroidota bacterium]
MRDRPSMQITNEHTVPVIRSKLLSTYPELKFGMSTRLGGVSEGNFGMNLSLSVGDDEANVKENRHRFFSSLGIAIETLAIPRQVHGEVVRAVDRPGIFEQTDALVTNSSDIALCVSIADCLPIFIFDPVTLSLAAVHSGWRGSCARILSKTISLMQKTYGAEPSNFVSYIGPAAMSCCYEVDEEVAQSFPGEYVVRTAFPKPHLDLQKMNKDILLRYGVQEVKI